MGYLRLATFEIENLFDVNSCRASLLATTQHNSESNSPV